MKIYLQQAKGRFVVCTEHGAMGHRGGQHGDPNYVKGVYSERELEWVNHSVSDGASLVEVSKQFKPTVLLGVTGHAKGKCSRYTGGNFDYLT